MRILLLGGTTDAALMARALAGAGADAVYSYAGRTDAPVAQPLPTRTGGFGGAEGLAAYLRAKGITHVIDATHPFAAGMSRNAAEACGQMGVPLIALKRPGWTEGPGDRWVRVADIPAAVKALPDAPARVFLAIGRQGIAPFAARTDLFFLLRMVDAHPADFAPPHHAVIDRGPFTMDGDLALMRTCGITHVVAKDAGGEGARAKLDAARMLGLPVILIDRPAAPPRRMVESVEEVMGWLHADLGVKT